MEKKFIGNGLEVSDLEKIAQIVKDNDLGKIKIKNGDFEVCVEAKRCPPPAPIGMPMQAMPMQAMPMQSPTQSAGDTSKPQLPAGKVIKSPIVGTFYSSSSPDAKPFVSVGDKVKKGDVVFIIESMKVMSEIQSEFDGVVKEILVNSGDAVEYDQPLMVIG